MERILLVGGVTIAVGIGLGAIWVLVTTSGSTLEVMEDRASDWLAMALGRFGSR